MPRGKFLPFDLIEEVFSHIAQSDVATISACSQTSKSFRVEMQKRLFEVIKLDFSLVSHSLGGPSRFRFTLDDVDGDNRAQQLVEVLTSNPDLASYVRMLCIISSQKPAAAPRDDSGTWSQTATILDLLSLLPNLEVFLFKPDSHSILPNYSLFSRALKNAIRHLLLRNRNTMECVGITAARYFSPNVLVHLPMLKTLSILSVSQQFRSGPFSNPPGVIRPMHLRIHSSQLRDYASLDNVVDLLKIDYAEGKAALMSFSQLHTLYLDSADATREVTKFLINATNPEVLSEVPIRAPNEAITIYNMQPWKHLNVEYQDAPDFDLSRLQRLTNLSMFGGLYGVPVVSPDHASTIVHSHCPWMGAILSTLPPRGSASSKHDDNCSAAHDDINNGTCQLSLKVKIYLFNVFAMEDLVELPLAPLIDVIVEKRRNGALRDALVEFVVLQCGHGHDDDEQWHADVSETLRKNESVKSSESFVDFAMVFGCTGP
ncbi:hypothetical protein CVT24_002086 [Panaeolus cyanescens]|uniref:F-box domain-containing protein n=1 Tax=Panaeolus cyanescens TaxID=181874 RepID=A0A409YIB0_9AGAR|nr:hypothetical protein CVT24_002086 [Panaeolus cyanescens]